ncbi:MAG: proline racemase family protein, partial [Gemmataceae bacterium]
MRTPSQSSWQVPFADSHTAGEPTRTLFDHHLNLGTGTVAEQCRTFATHHEAFRGWAVREPRGSEVLVGALLVPPSDPGCSFGVIFFNNVGVLGMCGHGLIGVAVTLRALGRLPESTTTFETPVGPVPVTLHDDHTVELRNVPSYRHAAAVRVETPFGPVVGDVAWGGNWFFLTADHGLNLVESPIESLVDRARWIRQALETAGITGAEGAIIDHIELTGPPGDPSNHARNFMLCPGAEYDRSPCGTGTSAKLACLAAAGKLAPGELWRQEG